MKNLYFGVKLLAVYYMANNELVVKAFETEEEWVNGLLQIQEKAREDGNHAIFISGKTIQRAFYMARARVYPEYRTRPRIIIVRVMPKEAAKACADLQKLWVAMANYLQGKADSESA